MKEVLDDKWFNIASTIVFVIGLVWMGLLFWVVIKLIWWLS